MVDVPKTMLAGSTSDRSRQADVAQAKATAIASLVSNLGDDLDEETKKKATAAQKAMLEGLITM